MVETYGRQRQMGFASGWKASCWKAMTDGWMGTAHCLHLPYLLRCPQLQWVAQRFLEGEEGGGLGHVSCKVRGREEKEEEREEERWAKMVNSGQCLAENLIPPEEMGRYLEKLGNLGGFFLTNMFSGERNRERATRPPEENRNETERWWVFEKVNGKTVAAVDDVEDFCRLVFTLGRLADNGLLCVTCCCVAWRTTASLNNHRQSRRHETHQCCKPRPINVAALLLLHATFSGYF